MKQTYCKRVGSLIKLYQNKPCSECGKEHLLEINTIHASQYTIANIEEYIKKHDYILIKDFAELVNLTAECLGPEDEEDEDDND